MVFRGDKKNSDINTKRANLLECWQEEVEIKSIPVGDYSLSENNGIIASVNTSLTNELINEGLVRDLIRKVQNLRKELDFEVENIADTVAYLQVKDLSAKDNNQVFLFNGWTFASSPTLKSIDHPVYDLWITGCENI